MDVNRKQKTISNLYIHSNLIIDRSNSSKESKAKMTGTKGVIRERSISEEFPELKVHDISREDSDTNGFLPSLN